MRGCRVCAGGGSSGLCLTQRSCLKRLEELPRSAEPWCCARVSVPVRTRLPRLRGAGALGTRSPAACPGGFPALSSARALRASQRSCWDVPKAMSGGPGPRQLTCGGLCKAKVFVALGWYQLGGVRCSDLRAGGSHSADRISLLRAAPRHCSRITRVWV